VQNLIRQLAAVIAKLKIFSILSWDGSTAVLQRAFAAALIASLSVTLLSCGGAGGVGSGGTGGFSGGTQIGAITGFGSLIVEGRTYAEGPTSYLNGKNPAQPLVVASSAARLGMQVELKFDTTSASEVAQTVYIRPNIIGTIESVGLDSLVVAGQQVRLQKSPAQATVFEGFASLSSLMVGNAVEIHGTKNATEELLASRIDLLSALPATETRVSGRISAITTLAAGSLRLSMGGLSIIVDSKTHLSLATSLATNANAPLLAPSALAVGQRISAYSSSAISASSVLANAVQVESAPAESNAPLRIGGVVREMGTSAGRFSIGRIEIDASQAVFSGGGIADLATGKALRVTGVVNTFPNASPLLKASEVKFLSVAEDAKIELLGSVSDFVDKSSFKIRNSVVDASLVSAQFVGGTASELDNDVLVKVEGTLVGNQVKVTRLSFISTDDTRYRAYVGTVSSYQAGAGTFSLQSSQTVNAQLQASTRYKTSGGTTASASDLVDGVQATIRGTLEKGVFLVSEIELVKANVPKLVKTKGTAYEIDLPNKTLKVNGLQITWDNNTDIDGDLPGIRAGQTVEVEGNTSGAFVLATKLKVIKP
jgi:Domain of unknown function (DUF5666)